MSATSAGPAGPGDVSRLERLLGGNDLAWLLARVRARLEAGSVLAGTVSLRPASAQQRAAVARVFGVPLRPGTGVTVRLEELDAVLRRSGAWTAGLEGAVVALTGPYQRRADAAGAEREAWERAWSAVADALATHPEAALRPVLQQWWAQELASGGARRAGGSPSSAAVLAGQLAAVLVRLPAPGVAIGTLANAATGSAHALDDGPLASLALRAARAMAGLPAPRQRTAEVDRRTWAAVGVVRDEVSSSVLTLGLPVAEDSATGRALAAWHEVGQPALLTLRHLRLDQPRWTRPGGDGVQDGDVVWSVENPVVLTAVADRALELRVPTPRVVCTAGRPSAAAVAALRGVSAAGWRVRHHGDLDPDGVAITGWLVDQVAAHPWRMSAHDYRAAVAAGLGRPADVGRVEASWDPALGLAMAEAQQVVEEEAVLDELVTDVCAREGS